MSPEHAMLNLLPPELPLVASPDGSVCIRDTPVRLEQIVADFEDGTGAEEIALRHDGLTLGDVYAVLAFYLQRRSDVERYLACRERSKKRAASAA
jgi:uncharacterized protein (DUF433 family)